MFTPATKTASRLRAAICGTSGSGKTYTALAIATALGQRVAVIDTEHGSAAKYSDVFKFDVCNLDSFESENFIKALRAAESAGYDVAVIDSLSHQWMGTGGTLEQVTEAKRRSKNEFTAWRDPSAAHTSLVEALLHSRMHVIVTMRTKTEYILEESQGRKIPRKVGMAPVQRDGMEYEFDVVGDMDAGTMVISKTRCSALTGKSFHHPGAEFAGILRAWLGEYVAPGLACAAIAATAELRDRFAAPAAPVCDHPADLRDRFAAACEAAQVVPRDEAVRLLADYATQSWDELPAAVIAARIEDLLEAVQQPATADHWPRLIDAAKSKGLIYTSECAALMEAHNVLDSAHVPAAAVESRIAEINAMRVTV